MASLVNGTVDQEIPSHTDTDLKLSPAPTSENDMLCNGTVETESLSYSRGNDRAEVREDEENVALMESGDKERRQLSAHVHGKSHANIENMSATGGDRTCDLTVAIESQASEDDGNEHMSKNVNDSQNGEITENRALDLTVVKLEVKDKEMLASSQVSENQVSKLGCCEDVKCDILQSEVTEAGLSKKSETKGTRDCENGVENVEIKEEATDIESLTSLNKDKDTADSEKENRDNTVPADVEIRSEKMESSDSSLLTEKSEKQSNSVDTSADDIEIIGESKIIQVRPSKNKPGASHSVVFVPAGMPCATAGVPVLSQGSTAGSGSLASSNKQSFPQVSSSAVLPVITPVFTAIPQSLVLTGSVPAQGAHPHPVPSMAPPKPKSSLDQIELIRWEIQNRINTRPKYFKPNPSAELGPLAKFLFDIGSDLIKESVYHDLVKIQSKKNDDDKLNAKEKEDLEKLREIERDLFATIGHLKLKLRKRCRGCSFQTESENVMFNHKQYPHEDNKYMRCAHCAYSTKQAVAFKFHMEADHTIQPKLNDKKAFYECDLCPYENNQEQKLILHKQRCVKQFRPLFNLHPSCLSGAEISLCLENIFYKPVVPKSLKLLQQKHAQQQAALAEARRQQAQMQVLAAQKNAVAKKQLQFSHNQAPPTIAPRFNVPPGRRMPLPQKVLGSQQQPVRYNSSSNQRTPRPTVANMLNNKQNPVTIPPGSPQYAAAGGFEVCEICGGYVKDRKALRIHFFYAHRIDLPVNLFERNQAPLYCATCYVRFWTAQGLRKHIDSHKEENQTRGVVGKCISCGHHVLNLLLHMRIVHNREMQHYINALMCMFCGGHFGSRPDCERHIINIHGHVDPVTGTLKSAPTVPPPPQQQQQQALKQASNEKKPANNSLIKGSVCVLCNLNFGRNVDLTRHCMRMHHTCMKCGMVVIDKASLLKHACLSSPSGVRDCSLCGETGFHPAYYVKHLRDRHLKKFTIRVARLSKNTIERWTKHPCPFKEPEEVLVEISDSDDDVPLKKRKAPAEAPEKRPRIGPASKICRISEKTAPEVSSIESKTKHVTEKHTENEVIDLDSVKEVSSADEDSRSHDSSQKRKLDPDSSEDSKVSKKKKLS